MYKRLVLLLALSMMHYGCTGKTGDELFAEGVKALKDGKPGSAIVLFRSALDKEQNNSEARYQLARAYLAEKKYEIAEKEFQKVERLNPAHPELQLNLAQVYNLLKKPDLAIQYAEKYLSQHANSVNALTVLGGAYTRKNMPQEAESCYLRALQQEPGTQTALLELAELYLKQRSPQQAEKVLEQLLTNSPLHVRANYLFADAEIALGRKRQARAIYQKLVNSNAGDFEALYKRGLLDLELGNPSDADKTADELISSFSRHAEGYRLKGFVLFASKSFPAAITAFQSANKLQPTVAGYYFSGLSLFAIGDLESALSQFRLILDRMPDFNQARLMTGAILLQQKRIDDAISEVKRLVEADDRNALAHNLLGSAYMAKGMYEEGIKSFDQSIRLEPKLIDTYLKKGMIHLSQGNSKDVEADLVTAVRIAPEAVHARIILSSFHLYQNNRIKAFATLREGLNGQKSDAALYVSMARIMFSDNKPVEAIRYLQQSKDKDPGSLAPYFVLADYYRSSGDATKALHEYSAVLQKQPANTKALVQMAALMESEKRHDEALALYLRAKDTQDQTAYLALAGYHELKGRLKEAKLVLAEALSHSPRSIAVLEQQGRLSLKTNNYPEALKIFSEIESLSPESGIPLLVATHTLMNNTPEALKAAKRATALKPGAAFGYLLLASLYTEQNNPDAAIGELKKAVSKESTNPQPALVLAGLYLKNGNYAMAITTCTDVIRNYPNYAPGYFTLGTILDARGQKKEAVKKYRAALALSSSYLPALNNLAFLCADGFCSKEEALRLAESAIAFSPDKPEVQDTLGYALLKNGRPREALTHLYKAEKHLSGNPTLNYHLALAHKALGEQKQAVNRLQIALRVKDFKEAHLAKNLLTELD